MQRPGSESLGRLIVFEGADGTGKSALAEMLSTQLVKEGRIVMLLAFPGNDPGTLGKLVYDLHHISPELGIDHIDPASMQLMHIAAHVDSINNRIKPNLARGIDIILDRYWWSTWVYGTITEVNPRLLELMIGIENFSWGNRLPDLLFLIERRDPLKTPSSLAKWEDIIQQYLLLVESEEGKYPIHRISNDAEIQTAFQRIDKIVNQNE